MVSYANGFVPASVLAPLDGQPGCFLRADAAAAWNAGRAEVKRRTGIVLTVRGWNRTYAEQVLFYLQRHRLAKAGERVCCYWQGRPYKFTGTAHAAPPGTSNHGWGLAVDVNDFGNVGNFSNPRRLKAFPILAEYGWTDTEGRGAIREPWHLVWNPSSAYAVDNPISVGGAAPTPSIPAAPTPLAPIEEIDPMSTPEVLAELKSLGDKITALTAATRRDDLVEVIGIPIVNGDRSRGQHYYVVDWQGGTKRHLDATQLAYLRARGRLDLVEWQPASTLANLIELKG